jgi:rRNA maturation protein Nop10
MNNNIGTLTKTLYLYDNMLSGTIPQSINNVGDSYGISSNYWWCPLPKSIKVKDINCYPHPLCCEYVNTNNELIYECSQSFNCTKYSFAKNTKSTMVDDCARCGEQTYSPVPTPTPINPSEYECCLYQYSGTTDIKALCVPSNCPQIYGYKYLGNYSVSVCSDCAF